MAFGAPSGPGLAGPGATGPPSPSGGPGAPGAGAGGQEGQVAPGWRKVLQAIAELKLDPSIDVSLIHKLELAIIQIAKTGGHPPGAPGAPGAGPTGQPFGPPPGPSGPPPPMGPGNMGGAPMQIAPGGGAGMSGIGAPNPDELRRVLAGSGGGPG